MLSAIPSSDPLVGYPFTAFDDGLMPWDFPDILSTFTPTSSNPVTSSSGSGEPNPTEEEQKPVANYSNRTIEDRKLRRMISNRESARRSRMRKQRHLENLRNQVNHFRIENQELNNGLQFLLHNLNCLRTQNEWLRSEQTVLQQKLSQILVFQPFSSAWPCNIVTAE